MIRTNLYSSSRTKRGHVRIGTVIVVISILHQSVMGHTIDDSDRLFQNITYIQLTIRTDCFKTSLLGTEDIFVQCLTKPKYFKCQCIWTL